jgi:hypothetical protein|nr:MAG TPA: PemK-like protein [Caudoviricetes sp.]
MKSKVTVHETITVKADTDCSYLFKNFEKAYADNPTILNVAKNSIAKITITHASLPCFDKDCNEAILLLNSILEENIHVSLDILWTCMKNNYKVLSEMQDPLRQDLIDFANYLIPLMHNTRANQSALEKSLSITLHSFKTTILQRSFKKIQILTDWLTKWSSYLQQESTFKPDSLKKYKLGEIILVDFGFNVGCELGGRHYAVVLDRNNNPRSGTVLVAPISSYDPNQGPHRGSVDLGTSAIHNYKKGSQIILNQIRYISKMRIERPKTSLERSEFIKVDRLEELMNRLSNKFYFYKKEK